MFIKYVQYATATKAQKIVILGFYPYNGSDFISYL